MNANAIAGVKISADKERQRVIWKAKVFALTQQNATLANEQCED